MPSVPVWCLFPTVIIPLLFVLTPSLHSVVNIIFNWYRCAARNRVGEDFQDFELDVFGESCFFVVVVFRGVDDMLRLFCTKNSMEHLQRGNYAVTQCTCAWVFVKQS